LAADLRAPTPSAAAEVVTPDGAALRYTVQQWSAQLNGAMTARLDDDRGQVNGQLRLLARLSPDRQIDNARQRVDDLAGRLTLHVQRDLERRRDRLTAQVRALDSANPSAILERGYAIVARSDGQRVTSAHHAAEGTLLQITLRDGRLTAQVREREISE
jgi:exodeoxyribonuclease VII large subunit